MALSLLIALLATMPVLAVVDEATAGHLIDLIAAILLAISAVAGTDSRTRSGLLKPLAAAALVPVGFMALQVVPLPWSSIVHPIWPMTAVALGEPALWGHVSLDPGQTLRSLLHGVALLALALSTLLIAQERLSAGAILTVISAVTAPMAAYVLLGRLGLAAATLPEAAATSFIACAALGAISHAAVLIRSVERRMSRRRMAGGLPDDLEPALVPSLLPSLLPSWPDAPTFRLKQAVAGSALLRLCPGLAGLAICAAAVLSLSPGSVAIALVAGLAMLPLLFLLRRFALPLWSAALLLAGVAGLAGILAASAFSAGPSGGLLRFASLASADQLLVARDALAEARWLGNGAGTFDSTARWLAGEPAATLPAANTALVIAVEGGLAALILFGLGGLWMVGFAFRGALRRRRDWCFPAAAAVSAAVMLAEAFGDASLTSPAVQGLAAISLGLGLAQSLGRRG